MLRDHWSDGPTSYLGVATTGFPNMFMILGPNGPFTNLPPTIETQVEWIADDHPARVGAATPRWLDVRPEIETAWTETCSDIADTRHSSRGRRRGSSAPTFPARSAP